MSRFLQTLQNLPFVRREGRRMGADQSNPAQLRSQRDEDLPYTSYSISKPIDGDAPKSSSSPRLSSKSKSLAKDNSSSKDSGGKKHEIVVVAKGNTQEDVDAELKKLEEIPVFLPLMRGTLNIPNTSDSDLLYKLDSTQVLQLCARYQEHLKQCSEAVAFDQNALCVRIKEVDFCVNSIYSSLTDRQKKFAKYAEQIQKINEMQTVLNRVKMNVEQTIPLMERLNSVLPPEDQLEPFTMKNK